MSYVHHLFYSSREDSFVISANRTFEKEIFIAVVETTIITPISAVLIVIISPGLHNIDIVIIA